MQFRKLVGSNPGSQASVKKLREKGSGHIREIAVRNDYCGFARMDHRGGADRSCLTGGCSDAADRRGPAHGRVDGGP